MGIFRKGEGEKRLAAARADPDAARARLAAIDANKAAALADKAAFVKWQDDRSEAAIELQIIHYTIGPMLDTANNEFPKLMNFAQRLGIIPDISQPGKLIGAEVIGSIAATTAEDICSHNQCDPRKWF